ncbi:MAG TPA: hypothetical protein VF790_12670 [Dissulfurispiraceae bacterium]
MISKQKSAERLERRQQKLDAGLLSARYPNVASIIIEMDYYKKAHSPLFMKRTINFFPGSAAFFLMDCMAESCTDGGFDFEPIIYTMVKGHVESGKGDLSCSGSNSSGHQRVDYRIAIQYN